MSEDKLTPEEDERDVTADAAASDADTTEVAKDQQANDAVEEDAAAEREGVDDADADDKEADASDGEAAEAEDAGVSTIPTEVATAAEEMERGGSRVETAVRNVAEEAAAEAAEDAEPAPEEEVERIDQAVPTAPAPAQKTKASGLSTPVWAAITVVALVLGLVLGRFVLGGFGGSDLSGQTSVSEADLDKTFATYTYNGTTETVTVREAIEQSSTVEEALQDDGTYRLPSAEAAVIAARNAILDKEADKRGITVSDEELATFVEQTLGTSDYDAIATSYGMDVEDIKPMLMRSARMSALREEVVGKDTPEAPAAPEAPASGKSNEPSKVYADYIIDLAGDEWDASKGTWASTDGPFATALSGYNITADGATYAMAEGAYYVAYQQYSEVQAELSAIWTSFVNDLMSDATIQVGSLVS